MADAEAAESRADAVGATRDSIDDFEFCILSSGGIVSAAKGAGTDMCVADKLFRQGKLLPLRASSASAAADGASVATLPRSESAASTVGLVSRSGSRSASCSSGSSSGCVSRSQSSKSASSDQGPPAPTAAAPPRRSLSSSVFYAHPSPSPQLRSSSRPRRSTGSAAQSAAAWGLFRLGVVGAPDVYPPPPPPPPRAADSKVGRGGGSRSARFEHHVDTKLGLAALFGDSFGCKCSPDVVEPVRTPVAAKRSRDRKKDGARCGGQGGGVARRSRMILDWLDELSIFKEKK